jgi:hypothetical protein
MKGKLENGEEAAGSKKYADIDSSLARNRFYETRFRPKSFQTIFLASNFGQSFNPKNY